MALHHKLCHVLGGSFGLPHAETARGGPAARRRLQRRGRGALPAPLAAALGAPVGAGLCRPRRPHRRAAVAARARPRRSRPRPRRRRCGREPLLEPAPGRRPRRCARCSAAPGPASRRRHEPRRTRGRGRRRRHRRARRGASRSAERGARVRVFEQAPALAEVGAGLQISPNGVAVLAALGLADGRRRAGERPRGGRAARPPRARLVARLPLGDACVARYGRPYWQFHRADLLALLADAAARGRRRGSSSAPRSRRWRPQGQGSAPPRRRTARGTGSRGGSRRRPPLGGLRAAHLAGAAAALHRPRRLAGAGAPPPRVMRRRPPPRSPSARAATS